MTKEAALKYKAEIAALQDGKVIQRRTMNMYREWSPWLDVSDPYFAVDPTLELRVKPEARELWIVTDKTGNWSGHSFSSEVEAKTRFGYMNREQYEIIHYKEVL